MSQITEAATRRELIDPALKKAGWDVNDPQAWHELEKPLRLVRQQNQICEVELPAGMCDYALHRDHYAAAGAAREIRGHSAERAV